MTITTAETVGPSESGGKRLAVALHVLLVGIGLTTFLLGSADVGNALQEAPGRGEPGKGGVPPDGGALVLSEAIWTVAFSPDGKRLVTAGAGTAQRPGQITIWDIATARPLVAIKGVPSIRSAAFSPDGELLVTGDLSGAIRLQNSRTGADVAAVKAHDHGVNSIAFSHDGASLISAGLDGTAKIWSVEGLKERQLLLGHTKCVFSAAFFRHGRSCVTASLDETAIIWDVGTGKEKLRLQGHSGAVEAVAVSPDDALVATASWDETIKLWSAETGKEIGTLPQMEGWVLDVAFSPNGKLLASAAAHHPHATHAATVRLWDIEGRKLVRSLQNHTAAVRALAFSRDGKLLASGSLDNTAKLWDMEADKQRTILATHGSEPALVLSVAEDGQLVASEPKGGEAAQFAAARARADSVSDVPRVAAKPFTWYLVAVMLIALVTVALAISSLLYMWRRWRATQPRADAAKT